MKDRITKLNQTAIELSNGVKFTIVHDFPKMEGSVNSFDAAFQSWLARTDEYTAEDFVDYVKDRNQNGYLLHWRIIKELQKAR